jgi:hypothetical protein
MATDGLPIDPRIPFYIPENWIEPEANGAGGQQFIRFPTAQTANKTLWTMSSGSRHIHRRLL